jgi:hypothetical protein
MKSTTLTVAAAAMVIFAQSAEAREHHRGLGTIIPWSRAAALLSGSGQHRTDCSLLRP